MPLPIIFTDADNTLWDTDAVFANAQTGLLALVEEATGRKCPELDRLAFVRRFDQALAERHPAHLRYPPMFLVWALVVGLDGAEDVPAASFVLNAETPTALLAQDVVDAMVKKYFAMLASVPELLPSVKAGLEALREAKVTVLMVTEGKSEKQAKILAHHELGSFFAAVHEVTKDQAQFERLKSDCDQAPVYVIGDQPDRDIVPAKKAGCLTVLVPGRFQPSWHSAEQGREADHVTSTFAGAVDWILKRA
jgi:putative hydrolase of the HAD superfamily